MAFHHSPKIVTNGLVLCLDAANRKSYSGTGTVWRDLAGTNNGTLTNGPTFSSANGGSIVFDGVNDFVTVPGTSAQSLAMWVSLWFNITTPLINTNSYTLVNVSAETTSPFRTAIYVGFNVIGQGPSNNTSRFSVVTYDANAAIITSGAYSTTNFGSRNGTWFNASAGWNGSAWKVYINGVDETNAESTQRASTFNPVNPTLIGGGAVRCAPVRLNLIQVYNRALSPAEVLQNYNATKGRFNL